MFGLRRESGGRGPCDSSVRASGGHACDTGPRALAWPRAIDSNGIKSSASTGAEPSKLWTGGNAAGNFVGRRKYGANFPAEPGAKGWLT